MNQFHLLAFSPENVEELGVWPDALMRSGRVPEPRYAYLDHVPGHRRSEPLIQSSSWCAARMAFSSVNAFARHPSSR